MFCKNENWLIDLKNQKIFDKNVKFYIRILLLSNNHDDVAKKSFDCLKLIAL